MIPYTNIKEVNPDEVKDGRRTARKLPQQMPPSRLNLSALSEQRRR
jgi:hypothetical protein